MKLLINPTAYKLLFLQTQPGPFYIVNSTTSMAPKVIQILSIFVDNTRIKQRNLIGYKLLEFWVLSSNAVISLNQTRKEFLGFSQDVYINMLSTENIARLQKEYIDRINQSKLPISYYREWLLNILALYYSHKLAYNLVI